MTTGSIAARSAKRITGRRRVHGHSLDLDRFDDVRVTRFVRDPRDLIVSGYFYHERSAEPWCDIVDPIEKGWVDAPGTFDAEIAPRRSLAQYLNEVSLEDGLLAELGLRRRAFEGMRAWVEDDPRVVLFRYEEILGNEAEIFDRIFRFYELPFASRQLGLHYARRFRAAKRSHRSDHIRDPRGGQWREVFTPAFTKRFNDQYGDLIEILGYARV